MPDVTKENFIIIKSIIVVSSFHEKLFQKEKKYCYGLMPGDFQIICGSIVGKIRRSPASAETPDH